MSLAIAAALGGVEYGIGAVTGEGEHELIRKQQNQSDLDFLTLIARENGWLMTVDHAGAQGGNVLRFTSFFAHLVPDLTLRYGESLIEFSPRLSTVGEIAARHGPVLDPAAQGGDDGDGGMGLGSPGAGGVGSRPAPACRGDRCGRAARPRDSRRRPCCSTRR